MKNTITSCLTWETQKIINTGTYCAVIVDKLIRLTAKLTESFADDILYDIKYFRDRLEAREEDEFILCFRERGVNRYTVERVESYTGRFKQDFGFIQAWKVSIEIVDGEPKTTLQRVDIVSIF